MKSPFTATFTDHIEIKGTDDDSYTFLPGGVLAIRLVKTGQLVHIPPGRWTLLSAGDNHPPGPNSALEPEIWGFYS